MTKILTRGLGAAVVVVIVATVMLILMGRQTIGELDRYRSDIQLLIASNIGMEVDLGELRGEWPRLVPIVEIANLAISDGEKKSVLSLSEGRADLDLVKTLRYATPIWRELAIKQLSVNFAEDADGRWNLQGFNSQADTDLAYITQPFLLSRLIHIQSLSINLHFFSGKTEEILGEDMLIENEPDFHRAQLSLKFAEDDLPAYFILEGQGDPNDRDTFFADGYLRFEQLNISKPLEGLTKSLMPEVFANLSESDIEVGGEVWVDIHPGGALDFAGHLSASYLPLNWLADVPPFKDFESQITGWFTPGLNWGVQANGLSFNWADIQIESLDMVIQQSLGSNWQIFDITVNQLDLELLSKLILETRVSSAQITELLDQTAIKGTLSGLNLGRGDKGYHMSGDLRGFHMLTHRGVPGYREIDGYFEVNQERGLFHIADEDGFEMSLPKVYLEDLQVERAEGTVFFARSANALVVRSDPMTVQMAAGSSEVMFSVEQPLPSLGQIPEFNLVIGGRNLDMVYGSSLLPHKMPKDLSQWLQSAVIGGNLKEFGLLFRQGPPRNNRFSKTTQLLFNTDRAELKYHPQWPSLTEMNSMVLVDDRVVDSSLVSAQLGEMEVTQARVDYGLSRPQQPLLTIDASLSSDIAAAIEVLAASPVQRNLGSMAQWQYQGQSNTELKLEIPLTKPSGGKPDAGNYRVTSVIKDASIGISDTPIEITDLYGTIGYSTARGLHGDNLFGNLWEQPLSASIYKQDSQQRVAIDTHIEPVKLGKFVNFPWADIVKGSIAIEGLLAVDLQDRNQPTTLQLKSLLQGVSLALPQPLAKSADEQRSLDMTLSFSPALSRLQGTLGELLFADLQFGKTGLGQGLIGYNRPQLIPEDGQLLIAAHLPAPSFTDWAPVIELFDSVDQAGVKSWRTLFDLKFDYLQLAGVKLQDISATVSPADIGFLTTFSSDLADGQIVLPRDSQQVLGIDLARLELPEINLGASSQLQSLDPRQFIPMDFSAEQILHNGNSLGSLAFELRPETSGALFTDISGNLLGIKPGSFAAEAPMEFFWGYDGASYLSRLTGPAAVDNIDDLVAGLGIPQVLDSESGRLALDLLWRGMPWDIRAETITGNFEVNLSHGSFYNTSGRAEATLKLVGLLNFANWLRRLKLDFSDVVGKNLAYNELQGSFSFDQGVLALDSPLKMQMPSGRMTMAGEFNLIDETVEAQLVATLPVGTNLPWLAGFVGGLPAAVGVFVTSKLLEKQVDRLSSINYTLSGPWDDIQVSVNEIFAAELQEQ